MHCIDAKLNKIFEEKNPNKYIKHLAIITMVAKQISRLSKR